MVLPAPPPPSGDISIDSTIIAAKLNLDVAGQVTEVPADGAIDVIKINVTAQTGIDLEGNNDITVVGTNSTQSGSDIIQQH